jgi:hypothetical protein
MKRFETTVVVLCVILIIIAALITLYRLKELEIQTGNPLVYPWVPIS